MDFYYTDLSVPCRSVMMTAKALGLTLNKKEIDLMKKEQMTPEFLAINPQHCLPTLVDGDIKLWESRPICTYLISQYGKDDSLYPSDAKTRALIDKMLYFDMGTLYKRFGDYVVSSLHKYPVMLGGAEVDPSKLEILHEALSWFNGYLDGHTFAVGNSITVADFVLIASVETFAETGVDLSGYPNIVSWVERCKAQIVDYEDDNGVGAKKFGVFAKSKLSA